MAQDMQPETEATGQGTPTPLRAVRLACLECCDGSASEVRQCEATSCPLWTFRFGRRPSAEDKAAVVAAEKPVYPIERRLTGTSGLKAVRRRCLDCSGGTDAAVRSCTVSACPLFEFRFGKNPNIVRSPERKEADARRLALLRTPALSPRPAGNAEKTGAQVLEGEYGPPDKRRAELASPSGLRRAARSVSLSEASRAWWLSCVRRLIRGNGPGRQWQTAHYRRPGGEGHRRSRERSSSAWTRRSPRLVFRRRALGC
jgi:hypothetical protein